MDLNNLAESLSPDERKLLPYLKEQNFSKIKEKSGMDETRLMRSLQFLGNKGLVLLEIKETKIIDLGDNGILYLKNGLPERRLLNFLAEKKNPDPSNPTTIEEARKTTKLSENEIKAALGALKKKAMIDLKEGRISLTATMSEVAHKTLDEKLIEALPLSLDKLTPEQQYSLDVLKSRKDIIITKEEKSIKVELTETGKELIKLDMSKYDNMLEALTPEIIKNDSWKGKKFRRYDLTSPIPKLSGGKKHFVNQATDYAKSIWLELGFKEMSGNLAVSGFWNFDALFTAQDHPVREMQDTFFIKSLKAKLPEDKLVKEVKRAHEGGVDKSLGWQYEWKEEDAKKVLLRTHTTCISSQTLNKIAENKEFPAKYFAIGKCFRNETVDWKHSFEFNQTEGIVIDENANFRQLLGYLTEYFSKMGYDKIRIRPSYFPYTEPSVEIDYWHPERKEWLELGGAGMFRPEVTIPFFGRHVPVLAWGPGFDRMIMQFYNIQDLRETYKNDLTKLRDIKAWKK